MKSIDERRLGGGMEGLTYGDCCGTEHTVLVKKKSRGIRGVI